VCPCILRQFYLLVACRIPNWPQLMEWELQLICVLEYAEECIQLEEAGPCSLLETSRLVHHLQLGGFSRRFPFPIGMPNSFNSIVGYILNIEKDNALITCSCSGVMVTRCPGVGVAMAIAFCPIGVAPPGVILGVIAPDSEGVCGVIPPDGVALELAGVSSQRLRRFDAEGVGVSWIVSPPRSVRGVSAQPEPKPGVNSPALSVFGVSSQRFRLRESSFPGVASHRRLPGVTPPAAGVSEPLEREGVSSQRATAGVSTSQVFFFTVGTVGAATGVAAGPVSPSPV
jgi:hypothetical protein